MDQPETTLEPQIAPSLVRDRLLVVDDQEANREVLRGMFERLGFEILEAANGEEALKILATRRPDIILLDLLMPGMDGFEVCRRIQDNPEWLDIPIIFLSTTDDKNLIARALEMGGVDYLTKPFYKPELLSRVRTHLMLKTARDHLKQLARDKEELLGMISHHLQNRLAAIEMSSQLLLDRAKIDDDGKIKLLAENIRGATNQMNTFIKSLLANAKADRGITVKIEPIPFCDATMRAVSRFEEAARGKDLDLRTEVPKNGIMVHADPTALDQIFDNLLSNAVKFSPPRSEIMVSVMQNEGHAECCIRDQGPGFTAEDKTKLYQRYTRLSARPTGGEPSTGLGLSITKKLVHAMNGELKCVSSPGKGATFVVRFPTQLSNT